MFPDNKANEHFRELLARMPTRFGLRFHVIGTTGYLTGAARFFRGVSKPSCTIFSGVLGLTLLVWPTALP